MKTSFALSDADRTRVSDAVAAAEAHTAGELVTILTDRSSTYRDVALAWCALVALLALAVFTIFNAFYLGKIDWLLASGSMFGPPLRCLSWHCSRWRSSSGACGCSSSGSRCGCS